MNYLTTGQNLAPGTFLLGISFSYPEHHDFSSHRGLVYLIFPVTFKKRMVIELRGTTYWKCYAKRAVLDKKKNLVFICSDQQRTDTMQCYGNDWVEAPNLNFLATQSYVFENSYVTQAVCTPARATMMTGLYPHSAGVIRNNTPGRSGSTLSPHTKCLPEMVPDDYVTAYFGKWHL